MTEETNITSEEISEIIIDSVHEYLLQISKIREQVEKAEEHDCVAQQFFFRGQANISWDVMPGVFRDNYLSAESHLIKEAYLRDPSEFGAHHSDFEKLAKLQHYGLPTRLLDVTSNPLVALYFAAQKHQERSLDDDSLIETDGVVLYKRTYGKGYDELEIKVISYLANRDMNGGISLQELLNELVDREIYSEQSAKTCSEKNYKSLIDILQNNYFVMSNMNNERLIRQSGAFLLFGKYNINYNSEDVGESNIQLAQSNAKSDFENAVFRIPYDRKKEILKELNFYNINEGSLFPELEHQMSYIKEAKSNLATQPVGSFEEVDFSVHNTNIEISESDLTDEKIEQIIDNALKKINAVFRDDCKIAIMENLYVDWYRRETIQSKIRLALTDALCKFNMSRITAKQLARMIVQDILDEVNKI